MKKSHKRIIGLFGLLAVAIMTLIAIMMPAPGASATSVIDEIRVRVVGRVVNAKFEKPSENIVTTENEINYIFNYENATDVRLAVSYTDKDGATVDVPNYRLYPDLDYEPGTKNEIFDIPANGFSFGKFVFSLYAIGIEGTELLYDSVSVEYIPVTGSAEQKDDEEVVNLTLDSYAEGVETVEVYLEGELIATIKKEDFGKVTQLSFEGKKTDEYTIELVAKDGDGNVLYDPYPVTFDYEEIKVPDTDDPDGPTPPGPGPDEPDNPDTPDSGDKEPVVPNTGALLGSSNISKEDNLTSGVIVFFALSIIALVVVAKGNKRNR